MSVEPHVFTADERRAQLRALSEACSTAAQLLREHGETWHADTFDARGIEARRLLADGYIREDLNRVAGQFSSGPDRLDPRQVDYNAPREPWQERVAQLVIAARRTAEDLRATATFLA